MYIRCMRRIHWLDSNEQLDVLWLLDFAKYLLVHSLCFYHFLLLFVCLLRFLYICFMWLFLTAWIITLTVALFTRFSPWCGRCHLFWFVFGDNNRHGINGDLSRLGSRSINIGQTRRVLFMFRLWSWHFWWFWIGCACAIWNTRCSSLLSY